MMIGNREKAQILMNWKVRKDKIIIAMEIMIQIILSNSKICSQIWCKVQVLMN